MQETHSSDKSLNHFDDEIDLREIFYILLAGKWVIVSLTTIVSIIGVIYSLSLPNIYESKALLVPVNPSSSIAGSLGAYNNLASSLVRTNFPPSSDEGNSVKAIKKISSLSFFEDNIAPNIYLPDLMAVKSWNSKTNKVFFDESVYDISTKTWIGEFSKSMQKMPSAQTSFKEFESKISLNVDIETGFVTLSIKHQSPFIAKQWAELIVNEINSFYRQKDKLRSEKTVAYLNNQFLMTTLSEIKQVLAELLQEETKKLALIEANQFYVFDYIDPPAVMEKKSEPKRSLICIFSALLGGILSVLFVLLRHYVFSKKTL